MSMEILYFGVEFIVGNSLIGGEVVVAHVLVDGIAEQLGPLGRIKVWKIAGGCGNGGEPIVKYHMVLRCNVAR